MSLLLSVIEASRRERGGATIRSAHARLILRVVAEWLELEHKHVTYFSPERIAKILRSEAEKPLT